MSVQLKYLHYLLTNGSELFALFCWLLFARRTGGAFVALGVQLVAANLVEILALLPAHMNIPKIELYNIYLAVEAITMGHMLQRIEPELRRYVPFVLSLLLIAWAVEIANVGMGSQLLPVFVLISAFSICAGSGWAFWRLAESERGPLQHSPFFWLLLALVLFFGGAVPLFTSFNYVSRTDQQLARELYWIVRILCAVRYISVAIACLYLGRSRKITAS